MRKAVSSITLAFLDFYRGPLVTQWNVPSLVSFFSDNSFSGTLNSGSALRQMLGTATGGAVACQTATGSSTFTTPATPAVQPIVAGFQTAGAAVAARAVTAAAPAKVGAVATAPQTEITSLPSTSTDRPGDPAGSVGLVLIGLGTAILIRQRRYAR